MREKALQVLVVEDNAGDVRLLREMFSKERPGSFELTHLLRMSDAEAQLAKGGVDIVLLDMGLPDEHGLDTVRRSLAAAPGVPVIVLTGLDDETLAAEAMQEGAQDYLIKGQIENRALPRALRHAIERHQLDRLLRDQQFYTRSLIESNIDALMTTDPHGLITDVNKQMEALTGRTRNELIGEPFKNYFTDPDRAEAGIKRVLLESRLTDYELTAQARDGRETVVSYNATTFYDRDRNLQGVFAAARDVTERKRFERTLQENNLELERAKATAEKANLAKSDFLSSMSHEIRTPLNAILGMADALWETQLDAEQMNFVEVFRRAGASLLTLINDILDLSKIEAGHLDLESIEFDLKEVVNQAVELTAVKARAKGIRLVSRLSPGLATSLIGDPARLRQILINLLGNAVKFTDSGEIVVEVQNQELRKSAEIEFSVSDTGVGIPPEKLETIFDNFTQADASTTRKYGGTGLGLGISRRIVEAMGGRLTAISSTGKGSTFRFTAQFDLAPKTARRAHIRPGDLHGKRILLIVEKAANGLILQETLRGWGLKSELFRTPVEALARFPEKTAGQQPYSLVIIDEDISGMHGFEAIAEIGRIAAGLQIGVIAADTKLVARTRLHRLVCDAMAVGNYPEPQSVADVERREMEPVKPARILIAEDSPDNRMLVQAYLKSSPYQLTFEENGKAAVDRLATADFDLILMDVRMPVMDGLTATRAIRANERELGTVPIRILALTANASSDDVERSRNAGCDAHLSKPISKRDLISAIEKYRRPLEVVKTPQSVHRDPIRIAMPPEPEDIVPGYLTNRRREVSEMIDLLAASDFERLSVLSHNLKGTARGYGFPDLVQMGAALEQAANQRDRGTLGTQLTDLGNYLQRVELACSC